MVHLKRYRCLQNTCVITHSVTAWHSPVDAGESGCFL